MKRTSFLPTVLKTVFAVAAIINLLILFLFSDAISERMLAPSTTEADSSDSTEAASDESSETPDSSSDDSTQTSPTETAAVTYSISMAEEALIYDGSSVLDLLAGVSVVSSQGEILELPITVSIQAGELISQKVLLYSAQTELGEITATRILQLENYAGPSIQLPAGFSSVEQSHLDTLLTAMPAGSFRADDGYGNDITQALAVNYSIDEQNPAIAHFVFSVVNQFNDAASVVIDLNIIRRPTLTLTTNEVIIAQHSTFRPFSYIASAVDIDGSSLMNYIDLQGSVDTSTPGEYILTYTIYPPSGNLSLPQTLRVIVQ